MPPLIKDEIQKITVTTPAHIVFDPIPQTYINLFFHGELRAVNVATSDQLIVRFNNDTTDSNYYKQLTYSVAAGAIGAEGTPVAHAVTAASSPAGNYCTFHASIHRYTNASYRKSYFFRYNGRTTVAGDGIQGFGIVIYIINNPITRVDFVTQSGNLFDTGSWVRMIGQKSG